MTWEVEAEPYTDPFERRITTVVDGTRLIERRVPRSEGHDHLYDLLENEARMGARLLALLRRGYPAELPRLIGYNLDVAEPIVLWSDHRGEPVGRYAGRLLLAEQRELAAGLFRAVRILSACGIVHRRIEPGTVRWDGAAVQLTGFGQAALVGDRRTRLGEAPYAAPAQREGHGRVAAADDLWSAAMVVYRTVTGREVSDRPDLGPVPALQPIQDVFSADPPSAAEVLARLRMPDPLQGAPVEPDPGLAEARAAFDRARRLKTGGEPVPQPVSQPVSQPVDRPEPAAPPSPEPPAAPRAWRALPTRWWERRLPLFAAIVLVVLVVALLIRVVS
ncbi:hypothetical protein C1I98_19665 [Spongiactinospora gelatinilytica]|uniref:Protein kinase domain-containing protein n=1 Tax=Spongiactinospora gelatinilytica TaxID=2666298 RepID=A0A2W2GY73_9ACTN|nr:hypothetical protein [Spongiactinospora gelatinilytica]PZG42580.1 hypothetical protein C1I98_19665 [Spongiactinospora gelatinilytica]